MREAHAAACFLLRRYRPRRRFGLSDVMPPRAVILIRRVRALQDDATPAQSRKPHERRKSRRRLLDAPCWRRQRPEDGLASEGLFTHRPAELLASDRGLFAAENTWLVAIESRRSGPLSTSRRHARRAKRADFTKRDQRAAPMPPPRATRRAQPHAPSIEPSTPTVEAEPCRDAAPTPSSSKSRRSPRARRRVVENASFADRLVTAEPSTPAAKSRRLPARGS